MHWHALESERDVPTFVDAAVALHRTLFERLAAEERPQFLDYWLRRFNEAHAYLHRDGDTPLALVTVPRCADLHAYRWGIRTLAWDECVRGRLLLPSSVGIERSFTVPTPSADLTDDMIAAGMTHEVVQLSAVRRLDGDRPPPGAGSVGGYALRSMRPDDVDAALTLLRRAYAEFPDADPALVRTREELREIATHGGGFCFVAVPRDEGALPVAVATYVHQTLHLVGIPVALVADLGVDPDHRRRGVATALQRHAYAALRACGYRWVYGNIDPGNAASRGQARRLGRTAWFQSVRFRAAPGNA